MSDPTNNPVQTSASDFVPTQVADNGEQAGSSSPQPSLFSQMMQDAVQSSQPQQQTPQPPTPDQVAQAKQSEVDNHPAVQHASVLHKVAETLAGGPQVKTTYHEDGSVTREKVPLTKGQLLTGLLANVLGATGQVADNLSRRMKGQAPREIQPLPTQQAAAARAQESDDDFNRVQNQKVRQAKIINANMEAARAAYQSLSRAESACTRLPPHKPRMQLGPQPKRRGSRQLRASFLT